LSTSPVEVFVDVAVEVFVDVAVEVLVELLLSGLRRRGA